MAKTRERKRKGTWPKLKRLGPSAARLFSRNSQPGAPPGIEHAAATAPPPQVAATFEIIDYGPEKVSRHAPATVDAVIALPPAEAGYVRWVNVIGLDARVISKLRDHLNFHTLAAEDVLHMPQRPQAVIYSDHFFIVLRLLSEVADGSIHAEQVSFFVYKDLVVTFQETAGDPWNAIRVRLETTSSRLRQRGADYLAYCLLDAVVDGCFPILESYGNRLEDLEEEILLHPAPDSVEQLYRIKRHLLVIRRAIWPVRELLETLQRDEDTGIFSQETGRYLRDVADHAIQVIDVLETYRELTGSLTDLYVSIISNKMNQVMKVLTLMASVFIPITFLAGVYGMNFENLPELHWHYGYYAFWGICLSAIAMMVWFFQRKGWFRD